MKTAPELVPTNSASGGSLAAITDLVSEELALVEDWLQTNLIDDNPFVAELLKQIFSAGGKRVRPLVVLLASKASARVTGDIGRLHIILAVLTELIHTASLVHDDVIDRASVRRGQETVNKKWNDKIAVLMGDLLFAQASICLARIMNPVVVGIYGQVLGDLCAGEIRQMRQKFVTRVDWDQYIGKSVAKTASLFSAGSHSGSILNGCPNATVTGLKEYGLNLGLCFQIVDDLLDVVGDSRSTGKAVGSDLRNGLITAPAMFVLEGDDAAARSLKGLIDSREIASEEGLQSALDLIKQHGGVERTVEMARSYARQGVDSLVGLESSDYREALVALTDFVIDRTS